MKGYKVFGPDWKCRDKQYKIGEIHEHEGSIEPCISGFHFCLEIIHCFSYYAFKPTNKVALVESLDQHVIRKDKVICNRLHVIKEVSWDEVLRLCNTGLDNTGHSNSGDNNSRHNNSGDYNSGDNNSGHSNSGNRNSGHSNSGNRNSGDNNSGHNNSGDYNSGYYNSGDNNSGDCNSGYNNSGYYNSGYYNSGHFNTDEPTVRMFNKDTGLLRSELDIPRIHLKLTEWIVAAGMTARQKRDNPQFRTTGGIQIKRSYKEAWSLWWQEAPQELRDEFLQLPNFDSKLFTEATGISSYKQKRRRK